MALVLKFIGTIILCACFGIQDSSAKEALCKVTASRGEFLPYVTEQEICCEGRLNRRIKGQECCGNHPSSELYFTLEKLCCDGTVQPKFVKKGDSNGICSPGQDCIEQTCSGKVLINKREGMYCGGRVYLLNETQRGEQGGTMTRGKPLCCGGYLIERSDLGCCEGKAYNLNWEQCIRMNDHDERIWSYEAFCIDKKYDHREQICCDGKLHDQSRLKFNDPSQRNESVGCCDALVMNPMESRCCSIRHHPPYETHLIPNHPDILCCGLGHYNKTAELCVNGTAIRKGGNEDAVCGKHRYNTMTQGCCGGVEVYSLGSNKCCEGNGVHKVVNNSVRFSCCNGHGMDRDSEVCCDYGEPCKKTNRSDDTCCINDQNDKCETYNSNHSTCLNGNVHDLPPVGHGICNYAIYNEANQLCCGDEIFEMSTGVTTCCGYEAYNNKTQLCCWGEVSDISPSEGSCCAYEGKALRHDDPNNPCKCGEEVLAYDRLEICCNGKKYPGENRDCCGDQFPYRTTKWGCCGDREVYRLNHSTCVNNEVVSRDPRLANLTDVQMLCNPKVGRQHASWLRHACQDRYAITANVSQITIIRRSHQTILRIPLTNVKSLSREPAFNTLSDTATLNMITVKVPNGKDVQCRKRHIGPGKYIIFFDKEVTHGHVHLKPNSSIAMFKYRESREELYTSVPHAFCQKKFNSRSLN